MHGEEANTERQITAFLCFTFIDPNGIRPSSVAGSRRPFWKIAFTQLKWMALLINSVWQLWYLWADFDNFGNWLMRHYFQSEMHKCKRTIWCKVRRFSMPSKKNEVIHINEQTPFYHLRPPPSPRPEDADNPQRGPYHSPQRSSGEPANLPWTSLERIAIEGILAQSLVAEKIQCAVSFLQNIHNRWRSVIQHRVTLIIGRVITRPNCIILVNVTLEIFRSINETQWGSRKYSV